MSCAVTFFHTPPGQGLKFSRFAGITPSGQRQFQKRKYSNLDAKWQIPQKRRHVIRIYSTGGPHPFSLYRSSSNEDIEASTILIAHFDAGNGRSEASQEVAASSISLKSTPVFFVRLVFLSFFGELHLHSEHAFLSCCF